MPKLAIARVAWDTQDASYQVQEKTEQGMTISQMDFESQAWLEWLAQRSSFAFQSKDGQRFTARKETRTRGGSYWVAYRKIDGKLTHTYIGRPEDVTPARMEQVAHSFRSLVKLESKTSARLPRRMEQAQHEIRLEMHWQDQILSTKFFVPVASHVLIARPRLKALLDEGHQRPLTLVSAPAGFGKTTLLSAWVQTLPPGNPHMAWVSLDNEDNDPVRFWSYVLTAFDRALPGLCSEFVASLHMEAPPGLNYVLTACLNRLSERPEQFLLVLDDYHLVEEQVVQSSLASFVEHLPSQVRVVLSTRTDPPLPLTRLRGHGQLLEVRADQLRTTLEEARAFLHEVMGVELAEQELAVVEDRTEGWLVGLQLVGLSLQGRPTSIDLFEEVSGRQGYILDYLTEEVLRQQPEAIQTFLLRTSILERLTASLCDTVLQQSGSQRVLEALENANLFVVSLDTRRRWYRYHALFAEVLHSRLEQMASEDVPALHLRASRWYEQQGYLGDAIQHAIEASDWEHAADLIESVTYTGLWGKGESPLVLRWLKLLPVEIVRSRPRLCVFYARILQLAFRVRETELWLQAAEAALMASSATMVAESSGTSAFDEHEREKLLGMVLAYRALTASYYGDGKAGQELGQRALAYLREQDVYERATVAYTQALTFLTYGQAEAATQSSLEAARLFRAAGDLAETITQMSIAASFMLMRGQLQEAWKTLQHALDLGREPGGPPFAPLSLTYAYQAEVLREWNQLDTAMNQALQGIQLGEQTGFKYAVERGLMTRFHIHLTRGELDEANTVLQQVLQSPLQVDNPYQLAWMTSVEQMRLWIAQGELNKAMRWAEAMEQAERSASSFACERQDVARVYLLLAQKQPGVAFLLLKPLLVGATANERWNHVIELRLLEAQAYQMRGEEQEALATLAETVRLAEPEGYIRSFVDEGVAMAALLSKLRDQQRKQGPTPYLDTLLAAFPPTLLQESEADHLASHPSLRQPLLDPLSTRELEVLHLLADGASNQEIAESLVITLDTVKRHVSNVLSKLAVSNRTQAVSRARSLGLL